MRVLKVTSTGLAYTGHSAVEGISLIPDSEAATAVVNDSLDGSGADKGEAKTDATNSADTPMYGERFATGIYATLAGSGAVLYIYIR